jgi:tRNA-splicing ligase RtcB (3'-phosphate/5'-hydroxy nucleic acid ligase)
LCAQAPPIILLRAGVDEFTGAYKDIQEVMRHQEDLVEILARFSPKVVKMDKGQ